MSFLTGSFLFAMVAAAGPALIHLLNRRRHRTVQWAAMDFLREAVRRNKKLIELRDILLLLLRTLAVALFVLAMAQPFWVSDGGGAYQGEPVHAVIVIDNSLSMGYEQLDKTLLDIARDKAKTFIDELPKGSEISIIPLCNQEDWHVHSVDATTDDALETLARIELVDRRGYAGDGVEAALQACRLAGNVPTKRVVFIGDMQENSWSGGAATEALDEIADEYGSAQLVHIDTGGARPNTWIEDFALFDGIASAARPAQFRVVLRHVGEDRAGVRVRLRINDTVVDERSVDMVAGGPREMIFKHRFDTAGTSTEPLFINARVDIEPDRLPGDDFRTVVVPVVSEVPVLFVDEEGDRENPRLGRFGDTFRLRDGLTRTEGENDRPFIEARHLRVGQVTREELKDARLVVLSGVPAPTPAFVTMMREYLQQGGQLLLAAGAEFDPTEWNTVGWQNGTGILPAPLSDRPIGKLPTVTATLGENWPTFRLAVNSVNIEAFDLKLEDPVKEALLSEPMFFKAVRVNLDEEEAFVESETNRLNERKQWLVEYEANQRTWSEAERSNTLSADALAKRDADRQTYQSMIPNWSAWRNPWESDDNELDVADEVARGRWRVLGNYDNGDVFLVQRNIGKGRVVMMTSGIHPEWNTMTAEYGGVLLIDQMARSLLTRSLPNRSFGGVSTLTIPVASQYQGSTFELIQPGGGESLALSPTPIGDDVFGLRLRNLGRRGVYQVRRRIADNEKDTDWSMTLSVSGPGSESDLTAFTETSFEDRVGAKSIRWVGLDDDISLEGKTYIGHNAWKWIMFAALLCLIGEMIFLAWPHMRRETPDAPIASKGGKG